MPLDQDLNRTEADLLAAYARGEAWAARGLTTRLTPRVYAQAFRMLGDAAEAEDVAQEAMMRLWRAAADWQSGDAKVTTWLYRVAANLCTDRLRRRRWAGPPLDDIPDPADTRPSAEARLQDTARRDALGEALMTLPERQRLAVILRHIEGLSNPEIAEILDLGIEAVESLTARGKRALKTVLAPQRAALGYQGDAP